MSKQPIDIELMEVYHQASDSQRWAEQNRELPRHRKVPFAEMLKLAGTIVLIIALAYLVIVSLVVIAA